MKFKAIRIKWCLNFSIYFAIFIKVLSHLNFSSSSFFFWKTIWPVLWWRPLCKLYDPMKNFLKCQNLLFAVEIEDEIILSRFYLSHSLTHSHSVVDNKFLWQFFFCFMFIFGHAINFHYIARLAFCPPLDVCVCVYAYVCYVISPRAFHHTQMIVHQCDGRREKKNWRKMT